LHASAPTKKTVKLLMVPRFEQVCKCAESQKAASEPKAPEVALCPARNDPQAPAWIEDSLD
jgi:hypothetical protein